MPSRHNTPCHRHDNRAVANTTRYPEGGTSREPTGPEDTRGLTEGAGGAGGNEARRERAKPKQPHTAKAKTNNRGKDNSNNQRPTGTRYTTKTPHRKHTDQKTPDTKGQLEQAEAKNRLHDTGPSTPPGERKRTRKKPRKHRANQSTAKTGGQKKHDTEKK